MIYKQIIRLLFLFVLQNGVHSFTIYDTRLGSSSTSPTTSGRVEVLTQRGWMPACAYSWHSSESRVLCHQLGYTYSSYSRGSSSENSLQYTFYCSGSESSISQCRHTFSYERQSTCSYIITVYCASCSSGSVQLRGGVIPEAGTVEYCISGTWRAVCHNNWDSKDAFVVCRQLGFPATDAGGYRYSYFGVHPFPSSIYFNCFGNEAMLSNCPSTSFLSPCRSDNVAGVYCKGDIITDQCINGHIRLAGGRDTNEGRVEVCSNGVWGTIYDSGWDSRDAIVACRQFGEYQPHSRINLFYNSYFGHGSGPILFAYLDCDGTESRLSDCSTYSSYSGTSHSDDAGVRCQQPTVTIRSNCMDGDVRLVNGTTPYEGRVEICYDGVWGSVCDNSWNDRDAAIVCLQLGFQGTNATVLPNSYFGDGEGPYHLSGLNCRGNESTLLDCPRSPSSSPVGYYACSPGNDAGVRCDATVCNHGDVRLFIGFTEQYGVAEVCINGLWADICSSGSTLSTVASAFCRQYTGPQSISFGESCCSTFIRRNTGNMTLHSVSCTGQSGIFIQDCSYSIVSGYSAGSCNLLNEMIVGCYKTASCNAGDVRLMDGNSTFEGQVEFCSQGLWGAVATSSWGSSDAKVVCRQLGLPWEWALADTNLFGQKNSRIVARSFGCGGTETRLSSCSYTSVPVSSGTSRYQWPWYTPAGVICQGINGSRSTECNRGDVRLVNGLKETEGRVEVCAYGYWATACDSNWNIAATRLVCKQMGFPMEMLEFVSHSPFGSNYQLPLVGVSCNSGASNISECQIYNQTSNCNHRRTVGVLCKEKTYHQVEIQVSPPQESYEIGSRVTFNCSTTLLSQMYQSSGFPLRYRWYLPDSRSSHSRRTNTWAYTWTYTITSREQSGNYYCLIYSSNSNNLLGQQRTKLNIEGFLKPSTTNSMSNPVKIQTTLEQRNITLQVNTSDHNVADILLELTWYHNGSKIIPRDNPTLFQSNDNKTLTISAFSSTYSGIYKAQFNQLFVHPFDEACKDEVLSLTRHYPVLKPVIFCVNVDGDCSEHNIEIQSSVRKISIRSVNSVIQETFDNLTLVTDATVLSRKELEHSFIYWYRNGIRLYSASSLQRQYNTLSLSQRFQQFNMAYKHSGTYEVQLRINMNTYLRGGSSTCQQYYNQFVSSYFDSTVILAKGYIDIQYYKDLIFDLDTNKKATTRDEGATLTCGASIEFPPFSMISLIKNGQILSSSTNSGSIQIDTRSADMNQFGLYTCQLNASGATFQKSYVLKEQANFRMTLDVKNSSICINSEMVARRIEESLIERIKRECQCSFDQDGFKNSTINCENRELTYATTLEYSNEEGSETASIIAKRTVSQVPFSMAVGGTQLMVTNACTDCEMPTTKSASLVLTLAAGGGLFIGGFLAAVLIAIILVIIVVVAVKKCAKSEDKPGTRRVEVNTDTLRYASAGAAHQDVSLKGAAEEYMTPQPKKPSIYQAMGPRDQPSQYETMQMGDQPIYEETF